MRKILIIILFLLIFCLIYGEDTAGKMAEKKQTVKITIENKVVYDVLGHEDFASNILLSWGALSTGSGLFLLNSNDELLKATGVENIIWGTAEIGAAMWFKGLIEGKKNTEFNEYAEQKSFQDILGYKFFIDLICSGIGLSMYVWGNEQIKGHGAGILIHGFSLAIFDGVNFLISKNLSERFN